MGDPDTMSELDVPLWELEESVQTKAAPALAYAYWTTVENWASDPGVERVEIDGPFQAGARGTTFMRHGEAARWQVAEAEPGCRAAIEMQLENAVLRFEWRFESNPGGGTVLTQRISLSGPGAIAYREQVAAGFGGGLRDGMLRVAQRMDEAATQG